MSSSILEISIVVACRNESSHIRGFLDSLLAQEMGEISWEAIIADGMSTDATVATIEEYAEQHPQLRLVANPGRIVATGLNAAIQMSRGLYILRMDAHTFYAPDYCLCCLKAMRETGADNVGGPARTRAIGAKPMAFAAAYHSPFSTGGAKFHNPEFQGWVDTVPYGCWRRELFDRIGLFDETLVRNQDDEFNLRLLRAGGKIWQDPAIVSWYFPRNTVSGLFNQYFQYGFWKVVVIRKHHLPGSWRHLVPLLFVLAVTAPPLGALLMLWLGHGAIAAGIGWLWAAILIGYVALNLTASIAAAQQKGWGILPYLPVIFGAYHFSYGLGFVAAMARYAIGFQAATAGDTVYVRITR